MAGDNELQIVLSLIDNASAQLKKITGDVKKDTEDISKQSDKASKSLQNQFKETSKGLKEFRREMFFVTAALAVVIASVKEAAEYNLEARKTFDEFSIAVKNLTTTLGTSLANALKGITVLVKVLNDVLELAIAGFIKAFSFISEFFSNIFKGPIQAYKRAIEVANQATDNFIKNTEDTKEIVNRFNEAKDKVNEMNSYLTQLNLLYVSGAISAQQYFQVLTDGNTANFQNMQTQMQLMQQMAAQENLMRNQSLMNEVTNTNSKMQLLNTLQEYHHTAYSTMMDFTNMAAQNMSTGLGSAISAIVTGTKKASEAFKEFGMSMISAIVEFVVQYGVQMLIAAALSKVIMASTIGQAAGIAAAWAPAALYASIATLGAADAAGVTGLATATASGMAMTAATISATTALASGTNKGFASGGWIPEPIVGFGASGKRYTFGEEGPEYVVPNDRLGGGSQTSIHIEINNPTVRSDEDIDKLTEEISQRLAREAERL